MEEFNLEDITRGFTGTTSDPFRYIGDESDPNFGGSSDDLARDFLSGMGDVSETEGFGVAGTGVQNTAATTIPTSNIDPKKAWEFIKGLPKGIGDFAKENPEFWRLLLGGIGAYLGANQDLPKATGGGYAKRYVGPKTQLTRTIEQGPYGPIARHSQMPVTAAAMGGIMHAYANGGQVKPFPMQDGGFVMTKRAVDGAGGPQGIRSVLPEARMIGGPPDPTGRKDLTPAYIQGPNGRTPAKVSNGEAYVPPGRDTRHLYALMRALERKA